MATLAYPRMLRLRKSCVESIQAKVSWGHSYEATWTVHMYHVHCAMPLPLSLCMHVCTVCVSYLLNSHSCYSAQQRDRYWLRMETTHLLTHSTSCVYNNLIYTSIVNDCGLTLRQLQWHRSTALSYSNTCLCTHLSGCNDTVTCETHPHQHNHLPEQ